MTWVVVFIVIYLIFFAASIYRIGRRHQKAMRKIYDDHQKAMDEIWARHSERMDEILSRNQK